MHSIELCMPLRDDLTFDLLTRDWIHSLCSDTSFVPSYSLTVYCARLLVFKYCFSHSMYTAFTVLASLIWYRLIFSIRIRSSLESTSWFINCLFQIQFLMHKTTHLCHSHRSYHSSLCQSFSWGSKHSYFTNPSLHRLPVPSEMSSHITGNFIRFFTLISFLFSCLCVTFLVSLC